MKNQNRIYKNPTTKPAPSQGKTVKAFIAVNCDSFEEARFRKVARAGGISFRMFCQCAFVCLALEIESELGVSFRQMQALSKKQVEKFYRRSHLLRSMRLCSRPQLN